MGAVLLNQPGCATSIAVGPLVAGIPFGDGFGDAWVTGCTAEGTGYGIYQLQFGAWVQIPGCGNPDRRFTGSGRSVGSQRPGANLQINCAIPKRFPGGLLKIDQFEVVNQIARRSTVRRPVARISITENRPIRYRKPDRRPGPVCLQAGHRRRARRGPRNGPFLRPPCILNPHAIRPAWCP